MVKFATPVVAAAFVLAACGGTTDSTGGDSGSTEAGGCPEGLSIGFVGALTGPDANLGVNISNGAQLAVDEHNAESGACQVTLKPFDTQGSPDQATGLATQAINDAKVVGIVGPAFSGESQVADPLFNEAGLVSITPSATNPTLSEQGWKTFFRVLGNDATQGPAAAKYIQDTVKATKVFVVDDASTYGKGLADIVRSSLGSAKIGDDTVQKGQTDFSGTVAAIRASGADAVFFGGYYAEAGLLLRQMRESGLTTTFVTDDGAKDDGLIEAAGANNAEGTIITCPCLPPEEAEGSFAEDYEAKYKTAPATYSAEGYDAATILLKGIADGKTTREGLLEWTAGYDEPGVTKQLKFNDKGEPADVVVWAYKVEGGKIVTDQSISAS
ncbi:branched-chain amino acid ABC transporter substrate-binding protein [Kineococcus gynurae]|uniref:Branched-chain amino acid ABC transporter substrate-binding protein n=1 Tax=Kineococcus gynurae TaxID=452979 RepID=A0ABV5LQJ7_9ACTN